MENPLEAFGCFKFIPAFLSITENMEDAMWLSYVMDSLCGSVEDGSIANESSWFYIDKKDIYREISIPIRIQNKIIKKLVKAEALFVGKDKDGNYIYKVSDHVLDINRKSISAGELAPF